MIFPASPDYTVASIVSTGYRVPVLEGTPNVALDVYVFGESTSPAVVQDMDNFAIAEALQYYAGDWTGVFYQSDPAAEWQINLSFWGGYEGGVAGSIEYVSLGCGGDLILLPVVLDFGLALEEQITYGEESCLSGGTINLQFANAGQTFPPSKLTFTWIHPNSDATGHGVLQRLGSSEPLTTGTGSLEIHAVTCPPGFSGPDYYTSCHGNGEPQVEFYLDGPSGSVGAAATQIETVPGPGITRIGELEPDNFSLRERGGDPGSSIYVFCSPDLGTTILVDEFTSADVGVVVPISNEHVVCDWYRLS